MIDKKFQKKYHNTMDMNSVREIQLGLQRFDKQRDFQNPFEESEDVLKNTLGPNNPL